LSPPAEQACSTVSRRIEHTRMASGEQRIETIRYSLFAIR
jgi:hypothetical protein